MKTEKYILEIINFQRFYEYLRKQYAGILGAEYDKEAQELKIFYEDTATIVSIETLAKLKIPLILKFRKRLIAPKLDVPNAVVTVINDNEFTVETFNAKAVRDAIKQKFPEFNEIEE